MPISLSARRSHCSRRGFTADQVCKPGHASLAMLAALRSSPVCFADRLDTRCDKVSATAFVCLVARLVLGVHRIQPWQRRAALDLAHDPRLEPLLLGRLDEHRVEQP